VLTLPSSVKIFIYTQPADMRCGFNKLSMLTENIMLRDPFSGHLFVFLISPAINARYCSGTEPGFASGTLTKLCAIVVKEIDNGTLKIILEAFLGKVHPAAQNRCEIASGVRRGEECTL
jgi:hypothetical protein